GEASMGAHGCSTGSGRGLPGAVARDPGDPGREPRVRRPAGARAQRRRRARAAHERGPARPGGARRPAGDALGVGHGARRPPGGGGARGAGARPGRPAPHHRGPDGPCPRGGRRRDRPAAGGVPRRGRAAVA
ncbi:MAG: hypothetical protein AVDCRST_MAG30-4597, partial [uncultured Solirubrobacteraceae bacterium]